MKIQVVTQFSRPVHTHRCISEAENILEEIKVEKGDYETSA